MQSKLPDLTDKRYIGEIAQNLQDIAKNYPEVMRFLEYYCGFNVPGFSSDAVEIAYRAGKRDVILTLKTIMRQDIEPKQIADFFKRNG